MNLISYLKLNDGEIYCNRCNGSGDDPDFTGEKNGFVMDCSKCRGTGKVNWIENIFGKQQILNPKIYMKEIDLSEMIPTHAPGMLFIDYVDIIKLT